MCIYEYTSNAYTNTRLSRNENSLSLSTDILVGVVEYLNSILLIRFDFSHASQHWRDVPTRQGCFYNCQQQQ